jgi:hypothetical protein
MEFKMRAAHHTKALISNNIQSIIKSHTGNTPSAYSTLTRSTQLANNLTPSHRNITPYASLSKRDMHTGMVAIGTAGAMAGFYAITQDDEDIGIAIMLASAGVIATGICAFSSSEKKIEKRKAEIFKAMADDNLDTYFKEYVTDEAHQSERDRHIIMHAAAAIPGAIDSLLKIGIRTGKAKELLVSVSTSQHCDFFAQAAARVGVPGFQQSAAQGASR